MTDGDAGLAERPGGVRPERPGLRPREDRPLLTLLGLGTDEDVVYRSLVDRPGCEPADLAGPLSEDTVRRALEALVERGLASVERAAAEDGGTGAHGPTRYRATSPLLALGPLLQVHRTALDRTEFLVADLAERHRTAQIRDSGVPVEVLSGASAIRRRLIAMQERARREVCSLVPTIETPIAISFEDNLDMVEHESMRRGVLQRSVLERSWLEQAGVGAALDRLVAQGEQIAVVEQVPVKMVLVDRQVALLPLDPERDETEPVALVVHRSGLLTALVALFEQCFAAGRLLRPVADAGSVRDPVSGTGPGGSGSGGGTAEEDRRGAGGPADALDVLDRRILALLYVGLTDAAIARQLGMGHRTVQRRLGSLMRRTGATTRFQLGWEACRAGWLD